MIIKSVGSREMLLSVRLARKAQQRGISLVGNSQ